MNKNELAAIVRMDLGGGEFGINDLPKSENGEKYSGTLLVGYDVDRNEVHVYAKNGKIYSITYNLEGQLLEYNVGERILVQDCVPNKRVFPEKTHYFFAKLLVDRGELLTFTEINKSLESIRFGEFYPKAVVLD